ncbi:MAG TPA: protein kinase [Deltaproteobacteria bacterium]|nr:protein kinase [Deltaproteobacteria bacterium]
MLDSWARSYAERWGLPNVARSELQRVLDGVQAGDLVDSKVETRLITDEAELPELSLDPQIRTGIDPTINVDRYEDMGLIKQGGMGEVRRVWDLALNRAIAMKVLRRDLAERDDLVLRFVEEAQATGQLEHPGIVPIYDTGRLPDGRPYFTMKEIRGRTLLDVIEELHAASGDGWGVTTTGWTFTKVIHVFQAVCEAVAYAHSRGVLHRDLKPTNVMVGTFGEVVVMDWGLAKIAGAPDLIAATHPGPRRVVTTRSRDNLYETQSGSIAGTPNYMAPEQARGEAKLVGPWSDVYALGALLYEILADRAPYEGEDLDEVVQQVIEGPPPPPRPTWQQRDSSTEEGLRKICARAMSRQIADRYMDAGLLADAVSGWLDTASARERALALVRRADQVGNKLVELRKQAATLRSKAGSLLASLPSDAASEHKRVGWDMEDQASELEAELSRKQARYVELLRSAQESVPNLPEARTRLLRIASPSELKRTPGAGWLTLVTEPAGARVKIRRFEAIGRRLVSVPMPELARTLQTPIVGMTLPVGCYQIRLHARDHDPLTVLARVERGELWSTVPAGTTRPSPIQLARHGEDLDGAIRIPHGWSWFGGDVEVEDSLPRSRAWLDPYLILRHPITNGMFRVFLAELERTQGRDAADERAPFGWLRRDGVYVVPNDEAVDQPVRRVTFESAGAFAAWMSRRTGRAWRLPREREWERAARGVDERRYPWGDFLDPRWSCVASSHRGERPAPASVRAYPLDVSPWGVRGMGGNVRDWCLGDGAPRSGPVPSIHRWIRGGHYLGITQFARSALRYQLPMPWHAGVGFRLVSPL